jgi:hypothetical protein
VDVRYDLLATTMEEWARDENDGNAKKNLRWNPVGAW